jgi:hypothetical protein
MCSEESEEVLNGRAGDINGAEASWYIVNVLDE